MVNKNLISYSLVTLLAACGSGISTYSEPTKELESSEDNEELDSSGDTEDTGQEQEQEQEVEDVPLTDFLQVGPYSFSTEIQTASVTDCESMEYSVYSPIGLESSQTVILGHGFARGSGVMVGWAEHFASWGVEVLLPTLCHYNVFAGVDHEMNGLNLQELADVRGLSEVVYAGHSAGGLAAVIAASQDVRAIGLLGLDTTDTQGSPGVPDVIGRVYAGTVTCPAFSIRGMPSSCNADGNGIDLFRMMDDYKAVRINGADHCDFENPTDFVCETACSINDSEYSEEEIRSVILTLGTAAVMSLTGTNGDGDLVWSTGLEELESQGIVEEVE